MNKRSGVSPVERFAAVIVIVVVVASAFVLVVAFVGVLIRLVKLAFCLGFGC